MLFRMFLLFLMINLYRGEDIIDSLYKSDEECRATACTVSPGGRACAGLLWRHTWMLTHASCIINYPLSSIYIKKGVVNCTNELSTLPTIATGETCDRHVVALYKHPQYPAVDLALLHLDMPFSTEFADNRTMSENVLTKFNDWMNDILFTESMKNIKPIKYQMYSTPVRMFLVTVVLPSASFIVFFLFIVFFTGKNKTTKIPYKNLNSKETAYV